MTNTSRAMSKGAAFAVSLACLTLAAAEAQAVSRYTATSLSCDRIQSTIKSEGRAFFSWRSDSGNLPRYGIFISNRRLCQPDEGTQRTYVPSSDKQACLVKRCVPLSLGDR
jgi:hypothetical protein